MDSEAIQGTFQDGTAVTIVISAADILIGMRRTRLLMEAQRATDIDIDVTLVRFLYTDVAAAMTRFQPNGSEAGSVLPIPFETFIRLSDTTGAQLEQAVYRLNPHWRPVTRGEQEDPKD